MPLPPVHRQRDRPWVLVQTSLAVKTSLVAPSAVVRRMHKGCVQSLEPHSTALHAVHVARCYTCLGSMMLSAMHLVTRCRSQIALGVAGTSASPSCDMMFKGLLSSNSH